MNRFIFDTRPVYRVLRHLLFFTVTVVLFAVIINAQDDSQGFARSLWITFVNSLFFFGYAYITIFLIIPELIVRGKIVWFALLFLLVGIGLSALKLVVSDHIFYSSISPENIERTGLMSFRFIVVNTKDMTFIVALFCIAKYIKDYLYVERLRLVLEKQNKQAKMKLYQSQFDPHFLFNTINNLYAISLLNPLKTRDIIQRIKTVLHYIIEEIQKDRVELRDEVNLVENYIQLEKLRYGKRLKVDLKTEGEPGDFQVPPMILFVLVENGFKHGSSLDAGSPWIKINISIQDNTLLLSVRNSKPKVGEIPDRAEKIASGLENLRKRLALVYGKEGFQMEVEEVKEWFRVELKIFGNIELEQDTYR